MTFFGRVTLIVTLAALAGCVFQQPSASEQPAAETAAIAATIAATSVTPIAPVISDFDAMRVALPTFDLRRGDSGSVMSREVSVVRDLTFETDSSILSRADVTRLKPLQAYLRANPLITVRIQGYGDGLNPPEREADISLGRAQAVARALLADIRIVNTVTSAGAKVPQSRWKSAEIIFE